jgi:excisionase family DNA binding protein
MRAVETIRWRDKLTVRPAEAAAILSLSERHVRRLIASGALPALRADRSVLIRTSDLLKFVEQACATDSKGRVLSVPARTALRKLRHKMQVG